MVDELHDIKPAQGFEQVYYPGEIQETNSVMLKVVFQSLKVFMTI